MVARQVWQATSCGADCGPTVNGSLNEQHNGYYGVRSSTKSHDSSTVVAYTIAEELEGEETSGRIYNFSTLEWMRNP